MKLKYTTKLFIVVNAIVLIFRTLQIIFLTESETAFLKDELWCKTIHIAGVVLVVLALGAMCFISSHAVRQPEKINNRGIPSVVVSVLAGAMFMITGLSSLMYAQVGAKLIFILAVLSTVSCILLAVSGITGRHIFKVSALPLIAYWLAQFMLSYLYYTEHPLRARTVYEIFAVCFVLLFFVSFGKAVSGVNSEKSFRRIYPLGLIASTLCMAAVVPEFLAELFGHADKVAVSAVSPIALVAAAIFTGFFTINTFKKSNTIHPKKKKRMQREQMHEKSLTLDSNSVGEDNKA